MFCSFRISQFHICSERWSHTHAACPIYFLLSGLELSVPYCEEFSRFSEFQAEILSLFREKNQVKEVGTGLECGISLKDFIDFKEKDIIESYLAEEIQRSI